MDHAVLSPNWKKLEATLKSTRYEPQNSERILKHRLEPRSTTDRERRRTTRMGAYVSSLPTASYGLAPPSLTPGELVSTRRKVSQPAMAPKQARHYVALDCEMVGTRDVDEAPSSIRTHDPKENSVLARVSIVDYNLDVLYDAYVIQPLSVKISDFRTPWSGITPYHLRPENKMTKPKSFACVHEEVKTLLQGRVLVGHALKGDLGVLGIEHPKVMLRDTSKHPPFRTMACEWAGSSMARRKGGQGDARNRGSTPSLKRLARSLLGLQIQEDENGHDSIEDARAAMALYKIRRKEFERFKPGRQIPQDSSQSRTSPLQGIVQEHPADSRPSAATEKRRKRKAKKRR